MYTNKKEEKYATIVIIGLIIFASLGVVFGVIFPRVFNGSPLSQKVNYMTIPIINTNVASSSDGKYHNIETSFSIELSEDSKKPDAKSVQSYLDRIVSELDYDKITAKNNIDYIEEETLAKLSEYLPDAKVSGVYVTGIQSGENKLYTAPKEGTNRQNDVIKGLFKNIK